MKTFFLFALVSIGITSCQNPSTIDNKQVLVSGEVSLGPDPPLMAGNFEHPSPEWVSRFLVLYALLATKTQLN